MKTKKEPACGVIDARPNTLTPGVWHVSSYVGGCSINAPAGTLAQVAVPASGDWRTNARLFANSKRLLEACEALLAEHAAGVGVSLGACDAIKAVVDEVRDAIPF